MLRFSIDEPLSGSICYRLKNGRDVHRYFSPDSKYPNSNCYANGPPEPVVPGDFIAHPVAVRRVAMFIEGPADGRGPPDESRDFDLLAPLAFFHYNTPANEAVTNLVGCEEPRRNIPRRRLPRHPEPKP
jgi:hypothetical protein